MNEMKISLIRLTPELAQKYLATNAEMQRPLSRRYVDIARDMRLGKWKLTGDTLKFDTHGRLRDGQHRCRAVIEANVAVDVYVATGLDPDAFDVVDTGKRRSVSDVLHMEGVPQAKSVATVARSIWSYRISGKFTWTGGGSANNATASEVLQIARNERDEIVRIVRLFGGPLNGTKNLTARPLMMAMFFILTEAGVDEEVVFKFFLEVSHGEKLAGDNHTFHLRNRLLAARINPRQRVAPIHLEALATIAWNKWRRGESVSVLKWATTGPAAQDFPQLTCE